MGASPILALALVLAGAARAPAGEDPAQRLALWVERARLNPRAVDQRRQEELRAILGELRIQRTSSAADPLAMDLALVSLCALEGRVGGEPGAGISAGSQLGRTELQTALARGGEPQALNLARGVLDPAARRPRAERLIAAELLAGAHAGATLPYLRAAAREEDSELARAASQALCGWDSPSVHLFFLEELRRGASDTRVIAEHFQGLAAGLDPALLEPLAKEVARRYLAEDWREAARARALVRALDTPRAVPILIEALATWDRRTQAGQGSKRIRGELVAELQRVSGRSLGAEPERWGEWWQAVREGRIALPADIAAAGGQSSSAAFFGLRAVTDRVLFVVDRSGSMKSPIGTDGRARHAEAIAQLLGFLQQSGEDTRFSVAVFGDDGTAWRSRLVPASSGNLEAVRRWLEDKPPEGATHLFAGLRSGLGLDARGRLSPERCEADTVIVLCDGATSEGSEWVARWLASENEAAQLVFHCVQIGSAGNGTLEALAQGSGGEFVLVQG